MITEHLANLFCCLCFDHSSHKSMNRKTAVRTGPRKFSSVYITILAQKGAGKKGGNRYVNTNFIGLSCIPRAVDRGSAKSEGFN